MSLNIVFFKKVKRLLSLSFGVTMLKFAIALCLLFSPNVVKADGVVNPTLKSFSLGLKKIGPGKRDPFFDNDNSGWENRMNVYWDVGLFNRYFMESDIYLETRDSAVKHVGWNFQQGIEVSCWLDIIHEHHSRHATDDYRGRFPVEDHYGVRVHFVRQKKCK